MIVMKKVFTNSNLIRKTWILCLLAVLHYTASAQTSHNVEVTNFKFTPDEISINIGDMVIWTNTEGSHNVNGTQATFPNNPDYFGNDVGAAGWTFSHVFTIPGEYNFQCDPHASSGMDGKVIVLETPPDTLTVNFTGMTPHVGQTGNLLVVDNETGEEIERSSGEIEEIFSLEIPGIVSGHSYTIDIFADLNGNGYYDTPPTDHSWRLELNNVDGNEVVDFAHNTNFTDIEWMHRLEVEFSGMTPHLGQMLTLYVRDLTSGDYLDTVVVDEIEFAEFEVHSYAIENSGTYQIDFYADLNGDGVYDPPPTDHAWRLETGEAAGDVILEFMHNTDFTNIFEGTGLDLNKQEHRLSVYPNPAGDKLFVVSEGIIESISIYNVTGARLLEFRDLNAAEFEISLEEISSGVYFVEVRAGDMQLKVHRLVKR